MTTFPTPVNDFGTTLGADHAAGSGTLALAAGSGADLLAALGELGFSAPSASQPIRLTVYKVDGDGNFTGLLADATVFECTGLTADTLTGCAAVEGTADQDFAAGSGVECLVTAGAVASLNAAVNAVESAVAAKANQTSLDTLAASVATTASPTFVGIALSGMAPRLGLLARYTTGGALDYAIAGTHYQAPIPASTPHKVFATADSGIASQQPSLRLLVPADIPDLSATYLTPTGDGSGLTALSASALASGTVATARLGSGTADGTTFLRGDGTWAAPPSGGGGGSGTVTSVSVVAADGVSGTVATATTTPAITLTLGAITPTSVAATGTVTGSNLSGTNTGDQNIVMSGDVSGSGTGAITTAIGDGKVTAAMLAGAIPASLLIGTDLAITESQVTGLESDLAAINSDIAAKADQTALDSLTTTVATKAPSASPTFTGTVTIGSLAGLLKGTAGAVSAAVAGTDYLAPTGSGAGLTGLRTFATLRFLLAMGAAGDTTSTTNRVSVPHAHTLLAARILADTPPGATAVIGSIERTTATDNTGWAGLWAGNTANRPQLAVGAYTGADTTAFDSTAGAAGTQYRAKLAQADATARDLTIELDILISNP